MEPFASLTSPTAVLAIDDVDTDQICPARFLKGTVRSGMGEHLFADWRRDGTGAPRPEFVLNRAETKDARVLVAGSNFGCGSSREHAVWALHDYGFRAVIARSFADIFRSNALKNGLLPVQLDPEAHSRLLARPGAEVTVDLRGQTLSLPDGSRARFPVEPFARYCLLEGIDELDFLLSLDPDIAAYEERLS
jgi:3-isopropylmalate/(R)-2-methylmalate dehydratase small subunit